MKILVTREFRIQINLQMESGKGFTYFKGRNKLFSCYVTAETVNLDVGILPQHYRASHPRVSQLDTIFNPVCNF